MSHAHLNPWNACRPYPSRVRSEPFVTLPSPPFALLRRTSLRSQNTNLSLVLVPSKGGHCVQETEGKTHSGKQDFRKRPQSSSTSPGESTRPGGTTPITLPTSSGPSELNGNPEEFCGWRRPTGQEATCHQPYCALLSTCHVAETVPGT